MAQVITHSVNVVVNAKPVAKKKAAAKKKEEK